MATPKPKKNRVTPSIAKLEATARSEGKNLHYDTDTENKPYTSAYFKARNSPVCALSPISVMPDNDTRDERGFRLINSDDSLLSDSELSGVLAANNNITSVPQCLEDTSIWKTQTLLYVPDSPSNSQEVDLSDFSQIGNASTGRKRTLDKGGKEGGKYIFAAEAQFDNLIRKNQVMGESIASLMKSQIAQQGDIDAFGQQIALLREDMGKDSRKVLSALKAQLQTTTVTSKFGELRTNVGIPKLKKAIKSILTEGLGTESRKVLSALRDHNATVNEKLAELQANRGAPIAVAAIQSSGNQCTIPAVVSKGNVAQPSGSDAGKCTDMESVVERPTAGTDIGDGQLTYEDMSDANGSESVISSHHDTESEMELDLEVRNEEHEKEDENGKSEYQMSVASESNSDATVDYNLVCDENANDAKMDDSDGNIENEPVESEKSGVKKGLKCKNPGNKAIRQRMIGKPTKGRRKGLSQVSNLPDKRATRCKRPARFDSQYFMA